MKTVNEYISEYIASLKEVSQGDMKVQVNNVDIFYMGQDYDIPVHRVGIFRDILCEGQKYSQCMFNVLKRRFLRNSISNLTVRLPLSLKENKHGYCQSIERHV